MPTREVFSPRIAWALVFSIVIFHILSIFLSRTAMVQVLNTLSIPISIAILIMYAPAWCKTLRKKGRHLEGHEALSLGIGACWVSDCGTRIYSIFWNALDAPLWLTGSYILPFLLYLNVLGGTLHITAPGAMEGGAPTRNMVYLGVVGGIAALLLLTLIWLGVWDVRASPGAKW